MLPEERVAAAFQHQPYDCVPLYQGSISSQVASDVLGREAYVGGGIQQYREACALWQGQDAHREFEERACRDAFDLARQLQLDLVRPTYWRMREQPSRRIDENTFFYGQEEGGWRAMRFEPELELYQEVDRSPGTPVTLESLETIVRDVEESAEGYRPEPADFPDLQAAQREFGATHAVCARTIGFGIPREPIWFEAIALRPDLVSRYVAALAERTARVPAVMAQMGLSYLMGGDDFASRRGPFYSPRAFRTLMLPALRKVSDACHAVGTYHLFASDGNLWPVADDLFGTSGIDGYYEVDRLAGMDLSRLRDAFPRLTLLGGIASETLHLGTKAEVVAEVRSALSVAKEKGGVVVGCSNLIVPATPLENFWAMMETLHRER